MCGVLLVRAGLHLLVDLLGMCLERLGVLEACEQLLMIICADILLWNRLLLLNKLRIRLCRNRSLGSRGSLWAKFGRSEFGLN